jgi:hypothetical protein
VLPSLLSASQLKPDTLSGRLTMGRFLRDLVDGVPELVVLGEGTLDIILWILFPILSIIVFRITWRRRHASALERVRQLELGQRCFRCDGTDLRTSGDIAECQKCGYRASLSKLRQNSPSSTELHSLTAPDDRD